MRAEALLHVAAEQHEGLVAKFHLPDLGLDSTDWWRAIRSDRWQLVGKRVIRRAGSPRSESQRVLAALLDASPGAVLHDHSALAWLGMRGYDLARLQVARPRDLSGASSHLATLHELRSIGAHDVVVVRGIATETALRAIWCEAARWAPEHRRDLGFEKVGRLLDQAHRLHLVTWAALHASVEDLQQRGRAGTVLMRALAAKRMPGSSPTESHLEDRFEKVIADAGVSPFRRQEVLGGHEPIGRSDFADVDLPLAVEINSLAFHTTPTDRAADERRHQALNDAGFTVGVIWEDDLWSRTGGVIATVRRARRAARAHDRTVIHSPGCPWAPPVIGMLMPR